MLTQKFSKREYSIKAPMSEKAAAKSVITVKPPAALPVLVQALEKYKTAIHWAPQAIGAYGSAAQPYLPNLEKLLADPATPSDLKEAIKKRHYRNQKSSAPGSGNSAN